MAESYVIPLDADDTDLDRAIDRSMDKLDRLADKASSVSIGGGGSRTSGTGIGGLAPDPWGRLAKAEGALALGRSSGLSDDDLRPQRLGVARAQAAVRRADQTLSVVSGLAGFASGGGFFPMLNRLADMIGPEALAGAGLAYGAYRVMEAGSAARRDLGSAYNIGGGSVAETASVSAVGRFLGRSAADSAGAAVAFGGALHDSTFGAGYFRSRGIVDLGGLTTDKDRNYLSAVRTLADEPNRDLAVRVARDTGLSSELWLRDLDKPKREELLNGLSDDMGPEGRRSEARYQFNKAAVGSWWGRQVRAGSDIISNFYNVDKYIFDAMRGDTAGMDEAKRAMQDTQGYDKDDYVQQVYKGHWAEDAKNNRGLNPRLPLQVRTTPGQSGGGPRVQQSMPPAARAQQLSENLEGMDRYCGGYHI